MYEEYLRMFAEVSSSLLEGHCQYWAAQEGWLDQVRDDGDDDDDNDCDDDDDDDASR